MGQKERKLIDKELLEGSKTGYRARANTGMGWQGKIIKAPQHILKMLSNWMTGKNIKHKRIMIIVDPRPFHGMDTGFFDVFGWDELTVCKILKMKYDHFPCMQEKLNDNKDCKECELNINVAVFVGCEMKTGKQRLPKDQKKYRDILEKAGGIYKEIREDE